MASFKIAPSILSSDFANLASEVAEAEAGGADCIHVDVMDGHFVPNITIGPAVVAALRKTTRLPLDVHLMIEHPDRYLEAFAKAGADILTVHVEAATHLQRTLSTIRQLGAKAGAALNPATPLVMIEDVLDDLDLILVMSVNPGFGGQQFIPNALPKLARCRALIDSHGGTIALEVDGGIGPETAGKAVAAGATLLVAGSAIYHAPEGVKAAINAIRAAGEAGDPSVTYVR